MSGAGAERSPVRRLLLGLTVAAIVAGVVLLGVGGWQLLASQAPEQTGAERRSVEAVGHQIESAPASPPTSVAIPAIDFVAPVDSMAVGASAVLDPPTREDVFWLDDYGVPGAGSDNTVYLIGHTSTDGSAVFDPLVNRAEQRPTVLPGDEVIVATEEGSVPYEIVATERHDRAALSDLEEVWTGEPGRLVLITCFFASDQDVASDNMVLFAEQMD